MSRWLGVGRSAEKDVRAAARAATAAALSGPDPRLALVFCSDAFATKELAAGIREVAPDVEIVGCSTAGEISRSGAGDASVVVTVLGGSGFSVATAAGVVGDGNLRDASFEAAGCMNLVEDRAHRLLLVLSDGLAGDQEEVVRGAYRAVGASVPLVGGCAGDGLKMHATYQFCGDEVLQNAVVAAAVASDGPFGIGVRHGWRKIGEPILVTGADGNVVRTLDDQPALDEYLRRLDAPPAAWTDPAAFTEVAMTHPIGVSRRSGEEVRFIAEANFDDRTINCIARVGQGGLAWIMEGDEDSVLSATDGACRQAVAALDGADPLGLVAFDCIARRGVVGDEGIQREVDRIAAFAGEAPVAGFYTYGEIARTHGISGFHNQTLVVLAVA